MVSCGTSKVSKASFPYKKRGLLIEKAVERRIEVKKHLKDKRKFERKTTEDNEEYENDLLSEERSGAIKKSYLQSVANSYLI